MVSKGLRTSPVAPVPERPRRRRLATPHGRQQTDDNFEMKGITMFLEKNEVSQKQEEDEELDGEAGLVSSGAGPSPLQMVGCVIVAPAHVPQPTRCVQLIAWPARAATLTCWQA